MQSLSKYNGENRYLLYAIDLFNKYAWVVPLKDKRGITIVNAFQNILDNSNRTRNKIWVDQGGEKKKSLLTKNLLLLKDLLEL